MNDIPLNFIKEIYSALTEAKTIPLSGNAPDFPWEELSLKIAPLLHLSQLKIHPRNTQFLSVNEITTTLSQGFVSIALEMTPLGSQAFWLMSKEDVAKLTSFALTPSNTDKGFSSPKFQEGFYYFLATQILHQINELQSFDDLSLKMGTMASIPQEEALCIDVEISHPKHTFWGKLICPISFLQAFKIHFSTKEPKLFTSAAAQNIDVMLHAEIGQTTLNLATWREIAVGDFILLDSCSFDPQTLKGTVTLRLHQTPLLRAKIKDNSLKIIDYAFYNEEQNLMNPQMPHEDENPEDTFEEEEEEEEASTEMEDEGHTDANHLWNTEDEQTHAVEDLISTEQIPLTLTVEVARLKINLDKLLQLSVGNVLELPVKPEQGVDVLIEGKKVAKAELVRLGEMLGIKILQMAK